jgi:hypothetical protein
VLAVSVTFADAFGTRLSCSGSQADIEMDRINVGDEYWRLFIAEGLNLEIFNCTVAKF